MIHLYCGNGKGKTTAAMGLVLRAAGSGMKILVVQFLKDNTSSEINSLSKLPQISFLHRDGAEKFTFCMTDAEKSLRKTDYENLFEKAKKECTENGINLLLLDEIIRAVNCGILQKEKILDFLKNAPKDLEIILTGSNPPAELLEIADYVSEIVKRKHPFDKGVPARKGIEY